MKNFILISIFLGAFGCNQMSNMQNIEEFTEDGIKVKEISVDTIKGWKQVKYWSKEGEPLAIRTYVNDTLRGEYLQVYPDENKRVEGFVEGIRIVSKYDSLFMDTIYYEVMNGEFKVFKGGKLVEILKDNQLKPHSAEGEP